MTEGEIILEERDAEILAAIMDAPEGAEAVLAAVEISPDELEAALIGLGVAGEPAAVELLEAAKRLAATPKLAIKEPPGSMSHGLAATLEGSSLQERIEKMRFREK